MDVYDVSDDLIKKLNDWKLIGIISGKFNELKENHSKVNFVEHALIDFKYIEKILLNVKLREEKCNKRSSEYRMLGNEQFSLKNKKYFQVSNNENFAWLARMKNGKLIIAQVFLFIYIFLFERVCVYVYELKLKHLCCSFFLLYNSTVKLIVLTCFAKFMRVCIGNIIGG